LQILSFLFPLVVVFELSLALVLRRGAFVTSVSAHGGLVRFFEIFNINVTGGLFVGGIAIVVVMLVWHLLNRDPWIVDVKVLGVMAIESLILTAPLLMISQLVTRAPLAATSASAAVQVAQLSPLAKVAISVGAGLYEELIFRMLLIAVIHTILVDVGKASQTLGAGIAVAVSAALFSWYHGPAALQPAVFYFLAGVYFGVIYIARGFGIVVAVHTMYDIVTILALNAGSAAQ